MSAYFVAFFHKLIHLFAIKLYMILCFIHWFFVVLLCVTRGMISALKLISCMHYAPPPPLADLAPLQARLLVRLLPLTPPRLPPLPNDLSILVSLEMDFCHVYLQYFVCVTLYDLFIDYCSCFLNLVLWLIVFNEWF